MKHLKHTLISDGRTDANLIPIINWTLKEVGGVDLPTGQHAEFWRFQRPPAGLQERIRKAVEWFPCDVLFIHRDAEKERPETRNAEIRSALAGAFGKDCLQPVVTVIPVRMLEAWLLFDESAIRRAAGNPNGKITLHLPPMRKVQELPDPKEDLQDALRTASELRGRRLKNFDTPQAFWRILEFVSDFSPLRQLSSFSAFEGAIRRMKEENWKPGFYGIEP